MGRRAVIEFAHEHERHRTHDVVLDGVTPLREVGRLLAKRLGRESTTIILKHTLSAEATTSVITERPRRETAGADQTCTSNWHSA